MNEGAAARPTAAPARPLPDAYVLAGGQSRRMGRNKALIELDGQPLLGRVLAAVRPVCRRALLVADDAPTYARFGLEVVPDRYPGSAALGGIATALQHSPMPRAFVLACDLPFLSSELLAALAAAAPAADVTLFETRDQGLHPLAAIYARACLPAIERCLAAGRLKVTGFFAEVEVRVIGEEELRALGFTPALLANVNTPDELDRARRGGPA